MAALTPGKQPVEQDFFDELYKQFTPVISAINSAESAAETAAYAGAANDHSAANYSANSMGLAGSSAAQGMATQADRNAAQAVAAAKQNQASALSTAFNFLTGQAYTEFSAAQTRGDTLDQNYITQMQTTALSTVKGLAESGITSGSDLQSKNPQAYLALLQHYNGDPSALDAALVMNQPNDKIAQSWTQGSTYYQLVTDPITGKAKVQSLDTGVNVPTAWNANKVSTTTLMMQDPNNPANFVTYTTDPISGAVTVSGSGTGTAIAAQYNSSQGGGSTSSSSGAASSTASQNYISAATTTAGINDPTTLFSTAINGDGTTQGAGIGSLVAGIMRAEGGSPTGVVNNPGNVKYTGAAGQTNSGVKASDGGTFASYATPEAGQASVAATLNSIAASLGPNATVQDVLSKYANLQAPTASGQSTAEYGLLANVPGFNPKASGDAGVIDQDAYSYLKLYMNGTQPTNTNLTGKRAATSAEFQKAQARAQDLYYQATGKQLPNIATLKENLDLINGNNALLNQLQVQEGTISANSDLLQASISADNINQNAPAINKVLDGIKYAMGDPGVAAYLAQNSTLSNELGSLLALKNASGTTVHDKLISADLIAPDASAAQEAEVVNRLMQEATNAHGAITMASARLYMQTDPLGLDPMNPLNDPTTFAQSVGFDLAAAQADYPNMAPQTILMSYINSQ